MIKIGDTVTYLERVRDRVIHNEVCKVIGIGEISDGRLKYEIRNSNFYNKCIEEGMIAGCTWSVTLTDRIKPRKNVIKHSMTS